ncbi:MAG: hypothetical protein Q8941_13680 [Bacteroidota bacterium]|nr:hypothetical protein [Bacteroidota bacterium]
MIRTYSSKATRKLIFQFIMENIDYQKRCLYLQEIISLGKVNDVWRRALSAFFDNPAVSSLKIFSKN